MIAPLDIPVANTRRAIDRVLCRHVVQHGPEERYVVVAALRGRPAAIAIRSRRATRASRFRSGTLQ